MSSFFGYNNMGHVTFVPVSYLESGEGNNNGLSVKIKGVKICKCLGTMLVIHVT